MTVTEITVFQPNSRKSDVVIDHLVPKVAIDALGARLGIAAQTKAESILKNMKRLDMSMAQFTIEDRRVRIAIK